MAQQSVASMPPRQTLYRLVLEGELNGSWADWFDCDELRSEGGYTVLEVGVLDQAQLQAVLRRVHDLHLRLVSVTRIEPVTTS